MPSFAWANGPLVFDVVFPYLLVKDQIPSLQLTLPPLTSNAKTPSFGAMTKKSSSPYNTVLWFAIPSEWSTTHPSVSGSSLNHSNIFLSALLLISGDITEGIILAIILYFLTQIAICLYCHCQFELDD